MICAPVLQDFSVGFSQGGKKGYPTGKKYGNITVDSYVETVEKACHCEEAQRADVAIRS